jgi:hypothetical protein
MMTAIFAKDLPAAEARKQGASLARWTILLIGAIAGLMLAPSDASARKEGPCPIPGCSDVVAPTCGLCETINGTYAVYFNQPG